MESLASPSESSGTPGRSLPTLSQSFILHGDREVDFTSAWDMFEVAIRCALDGEMRGALLIERCWMRSGGMRASRLGAGVLRTRGRSVFDWA